MTAYRTEAGPAGTPAAPYDAPPTRYDAVVVGAGPNGLVAAITIARAGRSVLLLEAAEMIGGGSRSRELTLPGFIHDTCSAVHPMAVASPVLRDLPLAEHGLAWTHPPAPLAHPFDDGSAAVLERSVDATAADLADHSWADLVGPVVKAWESLARDILGPIRFPRHPLVLARFGLRAIRSASALAAARLEGERARALFAGNAAHSGIPLDWSASAAFGLVLAGTGHAVGWPMPRGGAQRIADALGAHLRSLGANIVTGVRIRSLDEIPPARAVLLDLTPRQVLRVAGDRLPGRYRRALERFRYGPGAFKVDWALAAPIPWRASACSRAGTVHLGGSMDEIVAAEAAPWRGRTADRPFVLLAQPSLFDPTRAPEGRHTAWAYCHVPNACDVDMTDRIEAQVERFAPGFRDLILARHTMAPAALESYNPNMVGGDVNGGSAELGQLFFRPARRLVPYTTPVKGLYICSASTPPGGGVHGMCGWHAARAALRRRGRDQD